MVDTEHIYYYNMRYYIVLVLVFMDKFLKQKQKIQIKLLQVKQFN